MDSSSPFILDEIRKHLPGYLSSTEQVKLISQIYKDYPDIDYYRSDASTDFCLQGDGWKGFEIFEFASGQRLSVSGCILSNTCDISPDNKRLQAPNIVFATCVQMEQYERMLLGLTDQRKAQNYIDAIRRQSVTNRFFLPATSLQKDFVVFLDDIHTMPLQRFLENTTRHNSIRLSNAGYYVFVLKLAVHFCRLTDGENRF